MKISNFKYILTDIGGGWGTIHTFYGVTPDGDVYSTKKFNDSIFNLSTELDCELIGHLDNIELGLKDESELHYAVMDASDLTVYEVGETFKVLHYAPEISENNPKLYEDIYRLIRERGDKEAQAILNSGDFIIGEVNNSDEFRQVMRLLSGEHTVHTAFNASDSKKLIENIRGQLMDNDTIATQSELSAIVKSINSLNQENVNIAELPYGRKLSNVEQQELRNNYFRNQSSMKEFFNDIKSEVDNTESTEPKMRDLLVHTLECSTERVEPVHDEDVKTEFKKSPFRYGKLSGNYLVKGNHKVEHEIKELTTDCIAHKLDLYTAQSKIKESIIEKYGADFYDKSAEAINFIIEGTYSDYQDNRLDDIM